RTYSIEFNYKLSESLQKNLTEGGFKVDNSPSEEQDIRKIYFVSNYEFKKKAMLMDNFIKTADIESHRSKISHLLNQVNEFAIFHFFKNIFTDFLGVSSMYKLNWIHFFFILVINIFLCVAYYRSTNLDEDEYGESSLKADYNKKWEWRFIVQFILSILLFLFHIFLWIIYCVNFYYFYVVTSIEKSSHVGFLVPKIEDKDEEEEEDEQDKKAEKKKKEEKEKKKKIMKNRDNIIALGENEDENNIEDITQFIKDYYPDVKDKHPHLNLYVLKLVFKFIVCRTQFNMILIAFICNIIFFILLVCGKNVPFLLSIPMISIFPLIGATRVLFVGIWKDIELLLWTFISTWIALYILMWMAFEWMPGLFNSGVFDIDGVMDEEYEEPFCRGVMPCLLTFLGPGFFDGGIPEFSQDNLSYKKSYGIYIGVFFYKLFAFLLVNTLLANVFTSLITNAFDAQREEAEKKDEDEKGVCFICDFKSTEADIKGMDFGDHIKTHSIKKYISFLIFLYTKKKTDHSLYERIIYDHIKSNNISWLPYMGEAEEDED
ncbi:MAG: hypothetical protein MJ252_28710, partial [archaeon]|nr:hypothetical protein [archaeon]